MKKILIVEDDQMLRETLVEVLSNDNYELYEAENGEQGLDLVQIENFDLVITDILMPHKDGLEVIMHLKKLSPQTKIIAISGGGRVMATDYLNIAEKFGCDETFIKPFNNKELLEKVDLLLG
jgi:YesN/AraC family two-component response regulator